MGAPPIGAQPNGSRFADHIERELFPKPKVPKKRTTARVRTARAEMRIAA